MTFDRNFGILTQFSNLLLFLHTNYSKIINMERKINRIKVMLAEKG